MDLRMFCQKIEKISELLKDMALNENTIDFFIKVESYFNDVIDAFMQKDYDLAYDLWFRRDKIKKNAENLIKSLEYGDVDRINKLVMIAHYCKDMAALI